MLKEFSKEKRQELSGLALFVFYIKLFIMFLCLGLIRVFKFLYDTIYYYFTPYMILIPIFEYG